MSVVILKTLSLLFELYKGYLIIKQKLYVFKTITLISINFE